MNDFNNKFYEEIEVEEIYNSLCSFISPETEYILKDEEIDVFELYGYKSSYNAVL